MKTAMIGNRVEAVLEFDIDRIERENGIVTVAGRVLLESGKKLWVNVPIECCEYATEYGNGGEEIKPIDDRKAKDNWPLGGE